MIIIVRMQLLAGIVNKYSVFLTEKTQPQLFSFGLISRKENLPVSFF